MIDIDFLTKVLMILHTDKGNDIPKCNQKNTLSSFLSLSTARLGKPHLACMPWLENGSLLDR